MLFINIQLIWWVLSISLLSIGLLTYWEVQKKNKKRRLWRITSSFLAVLSLALIALKPAYLENKLSQTGIVLTRNINYTQLDSLKKSLKEPILINYSNLSDQKETPTVGDLYHLERTYPLLKNLYLVGEGIPSYDYKPMKGVNIYPVLNPQQEGLTSLSIEEPVVIQNLFAVKGTIQSNNSSAKWLIILDPSGKRLDSIPMKNQGNQNFSFKLKANYAGDFLYQILYRDEKWKTLQKEEIAIHIQEQIKPRICILNSTPSFETKFLKNYLAEAGYSLVIRSYTTKGKMLDEWINQPKTTLLFNEGLTENIDIILMDSDYWSLLSAAEQNTLDYAISEKGLGLLILAQENTLQNKPRILQNFTLSQATADSLTFSAIEYGEKEKFVLQKTGIQIQNDWKIIPLLSDSKSQPVIACKMKGLGKLGLSIIENTYPITLSGRKNLYEILWSSIIHQLTAQKSTKTLIKKQTPLAFVNQPLQLMIEGQSMSGEVVITAPDGKRASILGMQNYLIAQNYDCIFIPKQKGWHQCHLPNDSSSRYTFYVYDDTQWRGIQQKNDIEASKKYSKQVQNTQISNNLYKNVIPLSILWFYLSFLMAMSFLWIEQKL